MTRGMPDVTGYDFVPLPREVRRVRRPQVRFDRRVEGCVFGRVELIYELAQPVHVGSGFKRLVQGRAVRAMVHRGDHLVIPGTTMKGALRARYEAMTASCTCGQGLPENRGRQRMRGLSRSHPEAQEAVLIGTAGNHDAFQAQGQGCRIDELCPACALFGFQAGRSALRSRVSVTDFAPEAPVAAATAALAPQFAPRLHHCGDFTPVDGGQTLRVTSVYGRKFHFASGPVAPGQPHTVEVLPAGVRVRGALRLFNVEPAELGGLLAAVGFEPHTTLRVGAGKNHGLGELRLCGIVLEVRDHLNHASALPEAEAARLFRESADYWAAGAETLARFFQLG